MPNNEVEQFVRAINGIALAWQKILLEKVNYECPPEAVTFIWAATYSVLGFLGTKNRQVNRDQLLLIRRQVGEQQVLHGISGFFKNMKSEDLDHYKLEFDKMCAVTDIMVDDVSSGQKQPMDALRDRVFSYEITKHVFDSSKTGGILVSAFVGIMQECLQLQINL